MGIIGTIVVGFIVGLIARAIKPGNDRLGLIMTTLLGIAGAFIARYVGGPGLVPGNEAAGWIASVIGAVILLSSTAWCAAARTACDRAGRARRPMSHGLPRGPLSLPDRAMGEFDLIDRFFRRPAATGAGVALGIGDDCALLAPTPGMQLAVSSDLLLEGRHFLSTVDPLAWATRRWPST
jgi:uncharacterized membrane protein YeaQ/YmgE (transglycosylase-associated protein family)